jgi:glycosyltransferase involved in cell wall biosynthesis
MKVAMITRSTLYSVKGGDTVQVTQTARHLDQLGITTTIKLTNEKIDYENYDLLHFFNVTRPADILPHIKSSGKPFVLSPILIDYSEYDRYHRKGFTGKLFRIMSPAAIEYCKSVARCLKSQDKWMGWPYLTAGYTSSVKKILSGCSMILPNSAQEYQRITALYNYKGRYRLVTNGIDTSLFKSKDSFEKNANLVICVARIEGIKNQLNLIKALNHTRFTLLIIGAPAPNQKNYYQKCRSIAANNIRFIDHLPPEDLLQYYRKAKVHVLPSWFETTGLSSLEAAAMGCNIVISSKGDAKEYFEEDAFYCDPDSPQSIYEAIEKASSSKHNNLMSEKIIQDFTWQKAALQTLDAYKNILCH